jgi:predicted phage-related endonuclease
MIEPSVPTVASYPDRASWLAARRKTVGSSDAPVILGLGHQAESTSSKSLYALWAEKTGRLEEEAPDEKLALRFAVGHHMEALAEAQLQSRHGVLAVRLDEALAAADDGQAERFRKVGIAAFSRGFRACTPDLVVLPGTRIALSYNVYSLRGPVEVKTVESFAADDWQSGPSSYALAQVHHQMHVGGWSEAWIAAWIGFGDFRLYHVEPDAELMDLLLEEEERFWVDHVQADLPPAVDASPSCTRALKRLHPRDSGETIVLQDAGLADDAHRLEGAKLELKDAEELVKLLENRLREAIGDATTAIFTAGGVARARYTYKHQSRAGYEVAPTEFRVLRKGKI